MISSSAFNKSNCQDFPEGLEEEITIVDVPLKPANAKCTGHVDQRQPACDPMRWYIKVNRRLVYLTRVHFAKSAGI